MVRAPLVITPPPTTEVTMATRIEQLEQRLATMASFQHRLHSRGEAPTSYGGDDLFYMASVTQIEAFVAVTRSVIRASEPRGATVELDPHKGEAGRQAKLPQSFLLSKVVRTPSMVPTPPIEPTMGPTTSTSRVVDTDISSSVVSRMVILMLGSPTFSVNDLMASGVDLTRVFRLAATLCEHGSVVATSGTHVFVYALVHVMCLCVYVSMVCQRYMLYDDMYSHDKPYRSTSFVHRVILHTNKNM
jgi:hypothetical protein